MQSCLPRNQTLDPQTEAFYRQALAYLIEAEVPFLVGGAYALQHYTGIQRHTKDLDVFVRRRDCERVLRLFADIGFRTELTFPHWLAKVYSGDAFVDVIFSSGNGIAEVDDEWFGHAVAAEVFGQTVRLCPPEEGIWSKGYILERERYDGADIAHLIRACGPRLDWNRLLRRFGPHWRVLLSHLVLFGFIYPSERDCIPAWVLTGLLRRLQTEIADGPTGDTVCQGTLLSREQYLVDVNNWGSQDARLAPRGTMTPEQIRVWTEAITEERPLQSEAPPPPLLDEPD